VFAASVGQLVPALAPWRPSALVTFGFWSLVNMRGVALGARLNAVATVAKLVPLLLIGVGGLFVVKTEHLAIVAGPRPPTSPARRCCSCSPSPASVGARAERVRRRAPCPRHRVAMLGITALYIALQVSAGILGAALGRASAPLADAAGAAFGGWARRCCSPARLDVRLPGRHDAVGAALVLLARDGYLPRALAIVHPSIGRRTQPSPSRRCSRSRWRFRARSSASPSWPTCRRWRSTSDAR
jgi:amino acid transporter